MDKNFLSMDKKNGQKILVHWTEFSVQWTENSCPKCAILAGQEYFGQDFLSNGQEILSSGQDFLSIGQDRGQEISVHLSTGQKILSGGQ